MDTGVPLDFTRRDALRSGVAAAAAVLIGGCANKKRWEPLAADELNTPIPSLPPRKNLPHGSGRGPIGGVIPRRAWTSAGTIASRANPMNGVRRITIHHSGIESGHLRSQAEVAGMLESIRRAHVSAEWADIGYHYIIDPQGRVWEGRPIRYQGAHVKDNNEHNLGIMVMGNFEQERPTPAATATLSGFVAEQMRRYSIRLTRSSPHAGVFTHQELMPTACPGRNLQSFMLAARSGSGTLARA